MTELSEIKARAREAALDRRRRAARAAAGEAAEPPALRAAGHFLENLHPTAEDVVSAYWPVRDELDTRPLMNRLHAAGVRVVLPVVRRRAAPLTFRVWTPAIGMVPGVLAIPVPPDTAPELRPTVLVVPLLAFDGDGYRLGYGGGYYDRTLAMLRAAGPAVTAVGYAYRGQEVEAVPRAPTDEPLDWLVTEQGARRVAE